ncbi:MAG: Na/Pi cotransporter family protein [Lachnospiraceae bacterium]|nr:Na/Pi cotransporter family protein [Lachnospiraceae bacterium]
MSFANIGGRLGGLALFLYGMQMRSSGMEAAAGNKMKELLEKLTSNRFLGVLVGALITAIIQSSSATTVMVVGFVNSRMMTLRQAVWIIMGANIGTTITGQLIALDVGELAPVIAAVGVILVVFTKNVKLHHIGNIFAGLGILFIGMDMMSVAMKPLANLPGFVNLLSKFENPLLGILAGLIFTAIIQSSSASVGILQGLAKSGVIGLDSAAFVLFGQNIGTCITALLASIGTSRNARRTTIIHITFNIIGTIVFTALCIATPLILWMKELTGDPAAQIANLHTTFNITTTLLLLPFGNYLAKFAEKVLKETEEDEDGLQLKYITNIKNIGEEQLGVSAISKESVKKEILRMMEMANTNVNKAFEAFTTSEIQIVNEIDRTEEYVDFLDKEIRKYISKVITHERTETGSNTYNSYYTITGNIERISDHAVNIGGYVYQIKDKGIKFSETALSEMEEIKKVCVQLFEILKCNTEDVIDWHADIAGLEQKIDDMTKEYRNNMYARIKAGSCSDEGSILYSEMLTDFERIGDHCLNISDEMLKIRMLGN